MHRLRAPGGCPWDAEQTHETLKPYLIEEAYEVVEAIEERVDAELRDELGDLLLQVVFHAELAAERTAFTIDDVIEAICSKLVRRHPHVFADVEVGSSAEVAANWSRIKAAERAARGAETTPSVIAGIPRGLPSLVRAHRLGEKAAGAGFDWSTAEQCREKIAEELAELDRAVIQGDRERIGEEIGDLLFATASYARLNGLNADNLLSGALQRFVVRFGKLESEFRDRGVDIHDATPAELDEAWERVKRRISDDEPGRS
jgi:tetrapyrrole methylase family protein/MazG family protein